MTRPWPIVFALLLPIACAEPAGDHEETAEGADELFASIEEDQSAADPCPAFRAAEIERTHELVGYLLNSRAFRQCVDAKVRAQYMNCRDDYTPASMTDAIDGIFIALDLGNHLVVDCKAGEDSWSANLGTHGSQATQTINLGLDGGGDEFDSQWTSPRYPGWPWANFGKSMVHEFLHRHGYDHVGDSETQACAVANGRHPLDYFATHEPSIPYIVGGCAQQVLSLSSYIGPVEGAGNGCAPNEIKLVGSWVEADGPGSVPGYRICRTSSPNCINNAPCGDPIPGIDPDYNQYGICGACTQNSECAAMGANWACTDFFCRDTTTAFTTQCVQSLRKEVTPWVGTLGTFVQRTSGGYFTADAYARDSETTSMWIKDIDRGQLENYDNVHIKPAVDAWLRINSSNYIQTGPSPNTFAIRTTSFDGRIDVGDTFWFQRGSDVIEAVNTSPPYLKMTSNTTSSRRLFTWRSPTKRLVFLSSQAVDYWVEDLSGGLGAIRPNGSAPPRRSAFWLIDHYGGKLESGDRVSFQSMVDGQYWSTATNGSGRVTSDANAYGAEEHFTIHCVTCADYDDIKHGDVVVYRSIGEQKYLTVSSFLVYANATTQGANSQMQLVEVGQYREGTALDVETRVTWILD